jgi:isopentenyl-diphosphate delta-isomerase
MQDLNSGSAISDRKQDHIDLAFKADMANKGPDDRFFYEPMLSGHPSHDLDLSINFLGKTLSAPIWVSSMTGGTEKAFEINRRLATACAKFGLGMGLGSCRPLLDSKARLRDFDVRAILGPDLPLYANLGIAQLESLRNNGGLDKIMQLVEMLDADGLIVHINPLQEWLQPEGDVIHDSPLDTLLWLIDIFHKPIVLKEVGQGMGPESIRAILTLPVAAFEMAAHGGTNFSKLELLRSTNQVREMYEPVATIGHNIEEMVSWINSLLLFSEEEIQCREFIISGGIKDFLDGYYWKEKLRATSVYGQASGFLKYAAESQEALDGYVMSQIRGLQLANTFLKVK